MSDLVRIVLPGAPVGKGRPKFARMGDKGVRAYTPKQTVEYEKFVKTIARDAMKGRRLILKPVRLTLRAVVAVPPSASKLKRKTALDGLICPTTKPDLDNIEKIILDSFNGVVWLDDVQVVDVRKTKVFGEDEMVEVEVEPMIDCMCSQAAKNDSAIRTFMEPQR